MMASGACTADYRSPSPVRSSRVTPVSRITGGLQSDAAAGVLLLTAAAVALIWANSPFGASYEAVRSLRLGPGGLRLDLTVREWAADGLLAVFFFTIGSELKQELVHGELRDPRRAALPIAAAIGGALVPAVVFLAVNAGGGSARDGWGIPMATDPAFAIAILGLAGRRLPGALRAFLLTLATVDDMMAILVIALAYTKGLSLAALGGAMAGLALFAWLQYGRHLAARVRAAVPGWLLFGPLGGLIWALMHASGIHATIAGVAMGLLMPATARPGESASPAARAEKLMRPASAAVAVPLFALMSAGVTVSGTSGLWASTVTWGVLAGLIGGKFAGIFGTSWVTARFTSAHLGPQLAWGDVAAIGLLGGTGFTVSLLIAGLSYAGPPQLTDATGAVLLASATASLLSAIALIIRSPRHRPRTAAAG